MELSSDFVAENSDGERSALATWLIDAVPDLYAASQAGDAHRAVVVIRRALARLRDIDPECAVELNKKLRSASPRSTATRLATSSPLDRDSNAPLLRPIVVQNAPQPKLAPAIGDTINDLVAEHRALDALLTRDIQPRWTVLFVGAPGVGKTMLARWIASELGLPLLQLELPSVLSSFLGRTGQNLRSVLDYARSNRVLLLLDEFDAIAKKRDDPRDLGELNRIVSVLLKDLEDWSGPALVVAATNHPELIDPAIFRRFNLVVNIPAPDVERAREIIELNLSGRVPEQLVRLAARLCEGMSGSDLYALAQTVQRGVVLSRFTSESDGLLHLLARRASSAEDRRAFVQLAREFLPKNEASFQRLADLLGVAKSTVHADATSSEE